MKSKEDANVELRAFELPSIQFSDSGKIQAIPDLLSDKSVSKDAKVMDEDPDQQLIESKYVLSTSMRFTRLTFLFQGNLAVDACNHQELAFSLFFFVPLLQ